MKKVLLILFVLAICVLAFPQGVMAATESATVNANIVSEIDFTATGPEGVWALAPTGNTDTGSDATGVTFAINSNAPWGVHALLTNPPETGYLTPVTAESGAGALLDMLQVQNAGTGWQYVNSFTDILSGGSNSPTGVTRYRALRQATTLTDHRLVGSGNYYTATVTFECVPTA